MSDKTDHPEQDPAEGSREVVDRELARHTEKDMSADRSDEPASGGRNAPKSGEPERRPM